MMNAARLAWCDLTLRGHDTLRPVLAPGDLVYVGHMLDTARKAISKTQGLVWSPEE